MHLKKFSMQKKTYCSEEKELTKKEYLKLIETAEKKNNMRLSLIIQTVCATGIRISELKHITVESLFQSEVIVNCKGKIRHIFIVPQLKKKLYKYAAEHNIKSGVIFITRNGNSLNRSNIYREMKRLCKEAKIQPEKVFPHNLRHLFARTFYSIEKDIVKLADILGHANINTTRVYVVETGLEHKRKMEKIGLIK